MGRPPIEFDLTKVEMCGYFKATYETMAGFLNCTEPTIRDRMRDEDGEFFKAYKKGFSQMKMKLSEAQLHAAIKNHNATMLIWLGKQYLDQKDIPDNENNTTAAVINIDEPDPQV